MPPAGWASGRADRRRVSCRRCRRHWPIRAGRGSGGRRAAGPAGTAELAAGLASGPPVLTIPGGTYGASERTPAGYPLARCLLVASSWNAATLPREVGMALRGGRVFTRVVSRRPELTRRPVAADVVDSAAAEQALRLVGDVATVVRYSTIPAPTVFPVASSMRMNAPVVRLRR
jgi:hypothetical protein